MATPLSRIIDVITTLKSDEAVFANETIPVKHAELGVMQASIYLDQDLPVTLTTSLVTNPDGTTSQVITGGEVLVDLKAKEVYLCGLCAFRNYASQEHHKMASKAINFKTISFAVSGMTERSKEIMRIVWWCDNQIKDVLQSLTDPMGVAKEMRGE